MSLILNDAQALAVYEAATHLSNVGGKLTVDLQTLDRKPVRVFERECGFVRVLTFASKLVYDVDALEDYESWQAFREAYQIP